MVNLLGFEPLEPSPLAPDFEFEDDCESNESSESNRLDGKKSDTSSSPTASEECYTEQPMHKSGQEQSDSDPFNLMGLIEKQGINLVKKDKESVINCDTDKETDQPITTQFNKDQGNECQDGSCNEQSIYNRKVRNENTHTNITEIKEAMANNTINDGVEETKSSWPPGYTEYVSNIKRNKKAQGGTKCNSTRGSMESTYSMRFKFSEADFVRVSKLGNIIGLEMPSSFNEVNRLLHRMSEINETFIKTDNLSSLRSIWGNSQFDYALVPSSGHSGGIVSIWNPYIFVKHKIISNPNVLIVQGRWLDVKLDIYMVNVYAPQDEEGKQNLWRFITEFMSTNPGHYIIFGDFNSVRNKSERFGSVFSNSNASYFNEFIANGNLVDIPMGGYKFTRVDKSCTKGSRLDRFLIADSTWNHLGPLTAVALDRTISDHHPILLRRCTADYGPIPFKIYHSWFQADGFDKVVADFLEELRSLDLHIDVRQGLHHGGEKRMKLVNEIHKLEREQKEDLIQKSRNKWCVDGDENSKFFHGTINKKRKQLSVRDLVGPKSLIEVFTLLERKKKKSDDFQASGLQISVMKPKLYGIGATETELNHLAGYSVIDKFSKRLSKWRANCLLIRGRSILISAVLGSLPTYYFSLFRMPRTVCNKLEAMRSKFFWGAEDTNSKIHWVKWELVLASKDRGDAMVGDRWNGSNFSWNWIRPLRGGIEDDQYHRICDIIKQVTIVQTEDSWRWSCDKMDSFSVNGLRKHLDCLALPSHYLATRWNKIVPRKVNIQVWRLIKDRLPTRFNLWFRSIDNVSLICPMCNNGLESSYHTMSECIIAIKVWNSVVKWLNLNLPFQLPPNEL
ncbi:RNA-directed DNA polymerase, eukaryota [Tanacetum coccineum]